MSITKTEFDDYYKTSIRYTSKLVASHSSIYLVLFTDLPLVKQELAVDINAVRKFATSFTFESFVEKIKLFNPKWVTKDQLQMIKHFQSIIRETVKITPLGNKFIQFTFVFVTNLISYI